MSNSENIYWHITQFMIIRFADN